MSDLPERIWACRTEHNTLALTTPEFGAEYRRADLSAPAGFQTSGEIIEAAKEKFFELEHKGWDYRSFYSGFLEGATARPSARPESPKPSPVQEGNLPQGDHAVLETGNKGVRSDLRGLSQEDIAVRARCWRKAGVPESSIQSMLNATLTPAAKDPKALVEALRTISKRIYMTSKQAKDIARQALADWKGATP